MTISSELLRSHAEFVFARCVDGNVVAADMRLAADEIEELQALVDKLTAQAAQAAVALIRVEAISRAAAGGNDVD